MIDHISAETLNEETSETSAVIVENNDQTVDKTPEANNNQSEDLITEQPENNENPNETSIDENVQEQENIPEVTTQLDSASVEDSQSAVDSESIEAQTNAQESDSDIEETATSIVNESSENLEDQTNASELESDPNLEEEESSNTESQTQSPDVEVPSETPGPIIEATTVQDSELNTSETENEEESTENDETSDAPNGNEESQSESSENSSDSTSFHESTEEVTEPVPETTTMKPAECTINGRFPLPGNCNKYVLCLWTPNGYEQLIHDCPLNEVFDPQSGRCSENQSACLNGNVDGFTCSQVGTFVATEDKKKFYMCVMNNGKIIPISLRCPMMTVFDEVAQRCKLDFFPGDFPTSQTENENQPGPENGADHNLENPTGNGGVNPVAECTVDGQMLPDPLNQNRYFICRQKKDKFKMKKGKCSKTWVFDSETLQCVDPLANEIATKSIGKMESDSAASNSEIDNSNSNEGEIPEVDQNAAVEEIDESETLADHESVENLVK